MAPDNPEWSFPNEATPLGSPAYYAVRFSAPAGRTMAAQWFAWYELIDTIARAAKDPGVARLKLDWWREEIANTVNGNARHPLMIALKHQSLDQRAFSPMQMIIDAAEREIRDLTLNNDNDFHAACRASGGSLFELFCYIEPANNYDRDRCIALGAYCNAVERVRRVADWPQRLPYMPEDSSLTDRERREHYESLTQYPDTGLRPADEAVPGVARRLVALTRAIHRKMRNTGYPVTDRLIDRPPIAHLWTAWRCR